VAAVTAGLLIAACTSATAAPPLSHTPTPLAKHPVATAERAHSPTPAYEIITLLPRDAIPAIDDPQFLAAAEADTEYAPDEMVLGVSLNGESRAYSTSYLDRHEIVNDAVGGQKIAVTW
jgi:hypothetical protein